MRSSARFPAPRRRVPVFSCRLCHEPSSRKHNARVCGVSKSKWGCYPFFAICISLIADGEGKGKKKSSLPFHLENEGERYLYMSTSRCLAAPFDTGGYHWMPRAYDIKYVRRNIDTGRKRNKWIGQESRTEMETHFLSFGDEMTTTRWIRHSHSTRSTAERARNLCKPRKHTRPA
ncbi:hypothetical protein DFP73DRAFT_242738 [Morchella snyderi]|nr:hypothetical protein DFP73DRAFT_242738 [Morchella snyderi]